MHSHIYASCVIYGNRGYFFSCKGNVVLFQGNCVSMIGFHHIYMFHTHLTQSCSEGFASRKVCLMYVGWSLLCNYVFLCDHNQVLSMLTYVSLISHLAIFPSNLASSSFPELCTLPLQPSRFLHYLLNPTVRKDTNLPFLLKTHSP